MSIFQSYNEFGSYLCREVFTDMSVLPLVFPSNISCFSQGSYKVGPVSSTLENTPTFLAPARLGPLLLVAY